MGDVEEKRKAMVEAGRKKFEELKKKRQQQASNSTPNGTSLDNTKSNSLLGLESTQFQITPIKVSSSSFNASFPPIATTTSPSTQMLLARQKEERARKELERLEQETKISEVPLHQPSVTPQNLLQLKNADNSTSDQGTFEEWKQQRDGEKKKNTRR